MKTPQISKNWAFRFNEIGFNFKKAMGVDCSGIYYEIIFQKQYFVLNNFQRWMVFF